MAESERMAIIETKIDYLTEVLEKHVNKGCNDVDCKLNDRVVKMESSMTTYKRGYWVLVTAFLMKVASTFLPGMHQ